MRGCEIKGSSYYKGYCPTELLKKEEGGREKICFYLFKLKMETDIPAFVLLNVVTRLCSLELGDLCSS